MEYNKRNITRKGEIKMTVFIITLAIGLLGLCITGGNSKKGFIGVILALLYFPLGVIFALTKKYK